MVVLDAVRGGDHSAPSFLRKAGGIKSGEREPFICAIRSTDAVVAGLLLVPLETLELKAPVSINIIPHRWKFAKRVAAQSSSVGFHGNRDLVRYLPSPNCHSTSHHGTHANLHSSVLFNLRTGRPEERRLIVNNRDLCTSSL